MRAHETKLSRLAILGIRIFAVSLPIAFAASATANPATTDYVCAPAMPKGDHLTIDWNSGGKSITATFPNGQAVKMPIAQSGSGFRYARSGVLGKMEISGKGDKEVTLAMSGQPSRICTRQSP